MPFRHVSQYVAQIAIGFENPVNATALCGEPTGDRDLLPLGRTPEVLLELVSRHGFSCDACRDVWVKRQTRIVWLKARHFERTKRKPTNAPSNAAETTYPRPNFEAERIDDPDDSIRDGDLPPDGRDLS